MKECEKKSVLRCMNCKHCDCDMYKITQILIKLGEKHDTSLLAMQ